MPTTPRGPADDAAFARALEEARSGRGSGFEWLWHRFSRQVTAFARFQGSEDPEGIANDTFAAAFGRIAVFSGDSSAFVNFVFSIARNKIADEHRKRRRRVVAAVLDRGALDRNTAPIVASAETDALAVLTPETADALRRLTPEQREIIFLRLVADMSLEAVAEVTGRSVGAVKAMQHRALASMRKEMSPEAISR